MNKEKILKKSERGKIVWRDKWFKDPGIYFWVFFTALFGFPLFFVRDQSLIGTIGFSAIVAFCIYSLLRHLFSTKTALWTNGVLSANLKRVKLGVYKLKQKNIFVNWKDVRNMNFENQEIGSHLITRLRRFLVIRARNRKKYLYFVHDVPSFLNALKKLNKYHLLTKETKEKYK